MRNINIILCFTCILMGCAPSAFEKNYQALAPYTTMSLDKKKQHHTQLCQEPKVTSLPEQYNEESVIKTLPNYTVIGKAQWTSYKKESAKNAVTQAKKVGACLVLWHSKYVGTVHSIKREQRLSPWQTPIKSPMSSLFSELNSFDYIEKPVQYAYYTYTALFFAKKAELDCD